MAIKIPKDTQPIFLSRLVSLGSNLQTLNIFDSKIKKKDYTIYLKITVALFYYSIAFEIYTERRQTYLYSPCL